MIYKLRVSRREISHPMNDDVIQGGIGSDSVNVDFDAEWHGLSGCRAVFTNLDKSWMVPFAGAASVSIVIPWEAIEHEGLLQVGFVGFPSNGKRIVTKLMRRPIRVAGGCPVDGAMTKPTVDLVNDMMRRAEEALELASQAKTEASLAAQAARDAASGASAQTAAAKSAAQQAQAAARLAKPYHIQDSEPPRPERVQGAMWVQTEGSRVKSINKWDEDLPGLGLYPGADTYPGAESCPGQAGDWHRYTV